MSDFSETFQRHENDVALICLVHEPSLANLWGNLHPVGNLHERPFDLEKARTEHRNFVKTMENYGVEVLNVVDILSKGCYRGKDFDMSARIRLEVVFPTFIAITKCFNSSIC